MCGDSVESKQCAESNEMSKLEVNELSKLINHLVSTRSSKIENNKNNLSSKLNVFKNALLIAKRGLLAMIVFS